QQLEPDSSSLLGRAQPVVQHGGECFGVPEDGPSSCQPANLLGAFGATMGDDVEGVILPDVPPCSVSVAPFGAIVDGPADDAPLNPSASRNLVGEKVDPVIRHGDPDEVGHSCAHSASCDPRHADLSALMPYSRVGGCHTLYWRYGVVLSPIAYSAMSLPILTRLKYRGVL